MNLYLFEICVTLMSYVFLTLILYLFTECQMSSSPYGPILFLNNSHLFRLYGESIEPLCSIQVCICTMPKHTKRNEQYSLIYGKVSICPIWNFLIHTHLAKLHIDLNLFALRFLL